jgi:hypothetical protein
MFFFLPSEAAKISSALPNLPLSAFWVEDAGVGVNLKK